MINQKVEKALNEQINKEFYSSYLYLAMSAYFEDTNLKGFAKWMRVQAQEESAHAMIIFNHIIERGGKVSLGQIAAPTAKFASPLEVFQKSLEHEQYISSSIHSIVELANQEKDYASLNMLNWFVDEQVEEEANASEIVEQLKMVGDRPGNVFYIDRHIGKREFSVPSPLAGKL